MNLTPKTWNLHSDITTETAEVGDVITYSDTCNYNQYKIIEVDEIGIVFEDINDSEYIDSKSFKQLSVKWEFTNKEIERITY